MDTKSQIYELYSMIFNEKPDDDTLESLLKMFHEQNDSMDYLETYLRDSDKFKRLFIELEKELEITEWTP